MEAILYVPEGVPTLLHSDVTAYNAGLRNGIRTLLLDAFITVPTPAQIVMMVEVKHSSRDRYGLKLVGSVPKIAGGMGSIIRLSFGFHKNIFSATCPVGHLNTGFATTFVDGTHLGGSVVRPCTPVP